MSDRSKHGFEEQPEDGDLGLGHGCQPGGLPPFEILRRTSRSSNQLSHYRSSEPSAFQNSGGIQTAKRPINPLIKLSSKLGFSLKAKCLPQAGVQERLESDTAAPRTPLKQEKFMCIQGMANLHHGRDVGLQPLGIPVLSAEEKSCDKSTVSSELIKALHTAQAEIETLRQELESCKKYLSAKHESTQILLQQVELAGTDEQLNKVNESNAQLIKALNEAQFESEHRQSTLLQSQQTWAERFDSVCNEKLALQDAVDKLTREKKQLYAEKMSVCRERDELVALLNVRELQCYEKLSSVHHIDVADVASNTHCQHAANTDATAVKMAIFGACQCYAEGSSPCACAQIAAQVMQDIVGLNDKLDKGRQKCEESLAMADAYRIAFEEQMSRNRELANQLVKLHASHNGLSASRRKGGGLMGSQSLACITSGSLSGCEEDEDLILSLTEMVNESREALAHQRLAARLLALRTRRLENKLSRVSDDFVTPSNNCYPDESKQVEDTFSQRSKDCTTSYDNGGMQESSIAENKLSPVSNYFETPANVSYCGENKELNRFDETETFSCSSTCVDTVNDSGRTQSTRSHDAAGLVLSCNKLTLSQNAVISETGL